MKYLLILLSTLLSVTTSFAQERITSEEEARAIFENVDDRRSSISTETAEMSMEITDSRNRTRSRTMQFWSKIEGDDTHSLIIFSAPGNVRGTGFLSVTEDGNTTQRLYLPTVGRIQLIGSGERGDSFMGSDFTYEDLGDQDPDDYKFEWLEEYDDRYRVRASKPESQQYAYVEFEIDKERYTLLNIHYFDQEGTQIKRLEAENFEQLTDQLWSPAKMTMFDLVEERHTVIEWNNRTINEPVEDWRFTERGLRRGI